MPTHHEQRAHAEWAPKLAALLEEVIRGSRAKSRFAWRVLDYKGAVKMARMQDAQEAGVALVFHPVTMTRAEYDALHEGP